MSEKEVTKIIEVYDSVIADLKQALLDIKKEINNIDKVGYTLRNWRIVRTRILNIVNKALGSDNNE